MTREEVDRTLNSYAFANNYANSFWKRTVQSEKRDEQGSTRFSNFHQTKLIFVRVAADRPGIPESLSLSPHSTSINSCFDLAYNKPENAHVKGSLFHAIKLDITVNCKAKISASRTSAAVRLPRIRQASSPWAESICCCNECGHDRSTLLFIFYAKHSVEETWAVCLSPSLFPCYFHKLAFLPSLSLLWWM